MTTKNAAAKTRAYFIDQDKPLTLTDIRLGTGLAAPAVSMSLAYLRRQKYLTRTEVSNPLPTGRRRVYIYTYCADRSGG